MAGEPSLVSRPGSVVRTLRVLAGGRAHASGAVVLAYHDIGEGGGTFYDVPPRLFREQLSWAKSWGLRFVRLSELVEARESGRTLDGLAAVAFDDSLVGVHRHAMGILAELGIAATIFAVSDRFGEAPSWWPRSARVMTTSELHEAIASGMDVASHSRTHPSLPDLTGAELADEMGGSRAQLEDLVQRPVDLFAYPFGHYNQEVRQAARDASYRAAFSFLNGRVMGTEDPYRLPRINMWAGQRKTRLAYHLARSAGSWGETQPDTVLAGVAPERA